MKIYKPGDSISAYETLVLIETTETERIGSTVYPSSRMVCMNILRTFESAQRAEEFLVLLREADPTTHYELIVVQHID